MKVHRNRCPHRGVPLTEVPLSNHPLCKCIDAQIWHHLRISPDIRWEGNVRVFWAELRKFGDAKEWTVYVEGSGTSAPEKAWGYQVWEYDDDDHSRSRRIFLANSASMVRNYLHMTMLYDEELYHLNKPIEQESTDMTNLNIPNNASGEALRRAAEQLLMRAALIESRPEEPAADTDGTSVIWWRMQFHEGGVKYTYAATRAGDGLWYTTGPRAPKGYRWQDLINWIYESSAEDEPTIWVVSEWDILN